MTTIRLLLADDHAVVRSGLRMLLEAQPDFEIVGEAETGTSAVAMVRELRPDAVLMDIQMPDLNGIEATKIIKEMSPKTAVLALTMHEDDHYFFEMLHAGASGYVLKRAAPDELVQAIRTVCRGDVYLHPTMAKRLVTDYLNRAEENESEKEYSNLTPREQEVLTLIAEGHSNTEIANELFISIKTVDRHRENIMRKLNMHSRIDLVKYAIRTGLIDIDE
jgi:two-component system response regulator NreC